MSDPTFPAERHVRIPDKWFNDNPKGTFLIEPMGRNRPVTHDRGAFMPAGIFVGTHDSDTNATVATVCGWLHGENETDVDDYPLVMNIVHPLRFKAIVSIIVSDNKDLNGIQTDGRRIKIVGE